MECIIIKTYKQDLEILVNKKKKLKKPSARTMVIIVWALFFTRLATVSDLRACKFQDR